MVGYALAGRVVPQALFASIIVGCYATPMKPLFGDATDMHEDKLFGMKHLGVVLSWKGKIQLMTAAVLFIMTVTPLTYVQLGFNMLLPILIVGLSLVFLRFMFPIINHYDKVPYLKARKFAMGYFILLNVLLLIGTLDLPFFK